MRTVGVREFRDQASALLATDETLVIERHGRPIGFYVPIAARDRPAGAAALARLGVVVDEVLRRAGVDEETLASELAGGEGRR